jgi:hypothetical protein
LIFATIALRLRDGFIPSLLPAEATEAGGVFARTVVMSGGFGPARSPNQAARAATSTTRSRKQHAPPRAPRRRRDRAESGARPPQLAHEAGPQGRKGRTSQIRTPRKAVSPFLAKSQRSAEE